MSEGGFTLTSARCLCMAGMSCDQCRQDDPYHDLVGRCAVGVIVASGKHGDEVMLRQQVDFLTAITLRRAHGYVQRAVGGFNIKPWTPPEVAIAGVVDVALFRERSPHPGSGDNLTPLPLAAIGEEHAKLKDIARAEVYLRVLLVGVGQVVVPDPIGA